MNDPTIHDALARERPESVSEWMQKWRDLRETKIPKTLWDFDLLAWVERLERIIVEQRLMLRAATSERDRLRGGNQYLLEQILTHTDLCPFNGGAERAGASRRGAGCRFGHPGCECDDWYAARGELPRLPESPDEVRAFIAGETDEIEWGDE